MPQLVHEFAIDPEAIECWRDLKDLDGTTEWKQGRLISDFPSDWALSVFNRLRTNTVEDSRIEHFLKLLRSRCVRFGRPKAITDDSWFSACLKEHAKSPFRAIISRSKKNQPDFVLDISKLDSQTPYWKVETSAAIPRNAEKIAEVFSKLLKYSPSLYLIDPFFDPTKPKFCRPFQAICRAAFNEKLTQPKNVSYHLKSQRDVNVFQSDCVRELPFLIPKGIHVTFYLWSERLGGQSFHDRFICFKYGTANFGHGLDDNPNSEDRVNVTLLDEEAHKLRFKEMDPALSPFEFVHKFTIEGKR